jgi:predicted O-methyltransferase YrrM
MNTQVSSTLYSTAQLLVKNGQFGQAESILRKMIADSSVLSPGQYVRARSLLEKLTKAQPTTPDFYDSRLSVNTLVNTATAPSTWEDILSFHGSLATDEYVQYVDRFYRDGRQRYGKEWFYMDIVNILFAASVCVQPKRYLEIGVRRGRSVCTVARGCPSVDILACDMWQANYAGMENPGPEFVQMELRRHGHTGNIQFLNGDSHELIPKYFQANPGTGFDLITVDGDHSEIGAFDDLRNVISHINVGGVLVFDDISHPYHPYLSTVWNTVMAENPNFASYSFKDVGYGIAFAIRQR